MFLIHFGYSKLRYSHCTTNNRIECALSFYPQIDNQTFLKENNIQIESWGPFAEGKNDIFKNELLLYLSNKYHKTVAQIILRWLTQRGVVVIPKSVRKGRMVENFDSLNFEIDSADMEAIKTLDTKTSLFFDHRNPEGWLGGSWIFDSAFSFSFEKVRQLSFFPLKKCNITH